MPTLDKKKKFDDDIEEDDFDAMSRNRGVEGPASGALVREDSARSLLGSVGSAAEAPDGPQVDVRTIRVVVIGGGFAGRRAVRVLESHTPNPFMGDLFEPSQSSTTPVTRPCPPAASDVPYEIEVTLVDAKGFFEYTPSVLRCIVEPKHTESTLMEQPEGTIVGTATNFTRAIVDRQSEVGDGEAAAQAGALDRVRVDQVVLDDGRTIPCDYAIVCTGSAYNAPIRPHSLTRSSISERHGQIEAASKELEGAVNVLVVGGGFVGVELAAEIVGKYGRTKEVSLLDMGDHLLPRMPEKIGRYSEAWLEKRGCRLFLGEKVVSWDGDAKGKGIGEDAGGNSKRKTVVLESGKKISADVIYICAGFRPNADVLKGTADLEGGAADAWDAKSGFIKVSSTLQVDGYDNVFAVGDCMRWNDEKNAMSADLSATLASRNVIRMIDERRDLLVYPEGVCYGRKEVPLIAVLSLYKYHAVMQFNWFVLTGPIAAFMKWFIEFLQIQTARENAFLSAFWNLCEEMSLLAARYIIR